MTIAFLFDRREGYYAAQDIAPDHRYALMRHGGDADIGDEFEHYRHGESVNLTNRPTKEHRLYSKREKNYLVRRPDRKRQKQGHRL